MENLQPEKRTETLLAEQREHLLDIALSQAESLLDMRNSDGRTCYFDITPICDLDTPVYNILSVAKKGDEYIVDYSQEPNEETGQPGNIKRFVLLSLVSSGNYQNELYASNEQDYRIPEIDQSTTLGDAEDQRLDDDYSLTEALEPADDSELMLLNELLGAAILSPNRTTNKGQFEKGLYSILYGSD